MPSADFVGLAGSKLMQGASLIVFQNLGQFFLANHEFQSSSVISFNVLVFLIFDFCFAWPPQGPPDASCRAAFGGLGFCPTPAPAVALIWPLRPIVLFAPFAGALGPAIGERHSHNLRILLDYYTTNHLKSQAKSIT
jgi:hypothetical protein